jgi:hypothetical protein
MLSYIEQNRDESMKNIKSATLLVVVALLTISIFVQPSAANPTTREQSLKAYIDERYDKGVTEAGYALVSGQAKRVEATYGAMTVLNDLGYLDARPVPVAMDLMKNWTWKLQWKPPLSEDDARFGGFASFISGIPTIETNYYAVKLYQILWEQESSVSPPFNMEDVEINGTSSMFFISKTQAESGGFGQQEGNSPDMMTTYQAISSLYILADIETEKGNSVDATDYFNMTSLVSWIESCRVGDAYKLAPASEGVGVSPTAAAIIVMNLIGEPISGINNIGNWILDRQVEEDTSFPGGFEESILTVDPNIETTYYAMKALEITGQLVDVNSTVSGFILDCQAQDGAWGFAPEQEEGSLVYAAYAAESLDLIGSVNTYLSQEDPNNPSAPLFDWRYGVILGIILVGIIVGVISLRLD